MRLLRYSLSFFSSRTILLCAPLNAPGASSCIILFLAGQFNIFDWIIYPYDNNSTGNISASIELSAIDMTHFTVGPSKRRQREFLIVSGR